MKRILFFTLLLVATSTLKAQRVGIKGGLAQSWLRGKTMEGDTFERRNGVFLGVFLDFICKKDNTWVIQPEITFATEGGSISKEDASKVNIHSNTLRVPVLAKIRLAMIPKLTIEGGPQIMYRFGGEISTNDFKLKHTHNHIDAGFDVGTTYFFTSPNGKSFFIQARLTHNFINLLDTSIDNHLGYDKNFRSSIGQLGIGYKF